MNLRIFENTEDLAHAAARTILESGAKTVVLTGGSTPKRTYEILSESLLPDVTWILLDERYVPPGDPQSNRTMIERSLFARGIPERWLYFDTTLDDPHESVRRFEAQWKDFEIDLMLLGCGDDGHTASLFPGTPVLEVTDSIAAAVYVPKLEQWRVTLTLPVIRAAKLRLVLAAGESKAPVIRDIRAGADFPIVRATAGVETWWMVDRAAV